jgi:hypothetical protein
MIALRTQSFTSLPSRSIVFLAGGGRSIPAASFSTHRISCRFSHALLRDALDAQKFLEPTWNQSRSGFRR